MITNTDTSGNDAQWTNKLSKSCAYSTNVQRRFSRKRNLGWKNFIPHFRFTFSLRNALWSFWCHISRDTLYKRSRMFRSSLVSWTRRKVRQKSLFKYRGCGYDDENNNTQWNCSCNLSVLRHNNTVDRNERHRFSIVCIVKVNTERSENKVRM